MYVNGMVVQLCTHNSYKGIDGSGFSEHTGKNWYFNDDERLSEIFEPFYDEYINRTYWHFEKGTWVSVCNNMDYLQKYISKSQKYNIPYRVLLCETEIPYPVMELPNLKKTFLGYDYAYATGDNYSAVYNEVPFVFPQFALNSNGLFQTEEEIREYILEREKFIAIHSPYTLEDGDFTVFRLSEIDW